MRVARRSRFHRILAGAPRAGGCNALIELRALPPCRLAERLLRCRKTPVLAWS
jgi:hypothetical protein